MNSLLAASNLLSDPLLMKEQEASRTKVKNEFYKGDLVAIGASTGGPGAILKLLSQLPKNFNLPIIIVQHIQPGFLEGFVRWLSVELQREVRIAIAGEKISEGKIYVAATDGNLEIDKNSCFYYSRAPASQLYTPNINHFFNNLLLQNNKGSAILLTGMGDDGAIGMKTLAEGSWRTFVQSPKTCVVAGMPNSATKISPRHLVCSPEQIGEFIRTFGIGQKIKDQQTLAHVQKLIIKT